MEEIYSLKYLHQKKRKTENWWSKYNLKSKKRKKKKIKNQTVNSKKAEGIGNSNKVIRLKTAINEGGKKNREAKQSKSWLFEKTNKIDKSPVKLI